MAISKCEYYLQIRYLGTSWQTIFQHLQTVANWKSVNINTSKNTMVKLCYNSAITVYVDYIYSTVVHFAFLLVIQVTTIIVLATERNITGAYSL